MKLKMKIAGLIALSLVLCACSQRQNQYKLIDSEAKNFTSNDGKATITASLVTVDDDHIAFTMSNTSDYDILYGNIGGAMLQKKDGDEWVYCDLKVGDSVAVTAEAYGFEKGSTRECSYNYDYYYGKLKPGDYRLVFASLNYVDDTNTSVDARSFTIELEFKVE